MAHTCVKILVDDDGEKVEKPKWHLSVIADGCNRTLCSAEAYGEGESSAAYKEKLVKRGGITCPFCLASLKDFKAVKL